MKDDSSPTLLTIASVDDLFGAVPALLHFHPSESLVLVLVESGRVEVAARVDLARVRRRRSLRTALEPLLHRFPESDVLAIAYSGDGRAAWRVLELLRSEVGERCAVALHADGRRWYDSPDDVGRPYDPASTAVAAGAAYAGVEVRGSRAELAASLVGTFGRDEREAAMAEVATRWPEGPSREAAGDALLLSWRAGRSLTLHERCLLAVLAREPEWAERAILDTTRENAGDRFECWAQVAQASPGPMGRGALTLLALAAWVRGDGAMAQVCLERLADLSHSDDWTRFVDLACAMALHPDLWEEVRSGYLALAESVAVAAVGT